MSSFLSLQGNEYQNNLKRLLDLVAALSLLIFFTPISLVVVVAIKLTSVGPVLADVPDRVGMKGSFFKMYKFRSMVVNAHFLLRRDKKFKKLYEEYRQGSFKLKKDPRITLVGKFIRRHSLDEIPQLINVLKGEMSLVGPRAYYPDELQDQQKKYPQTRELVKKVLSVRPGITGLWQVSGRSNINFDKRIAMDARYVDNISLVEDVKIIAKTPLAMISGRGAV